MTNTERAAEHVKQAETILADTKATANPWTSRANAVGAMATAHATLALYFQREAERENG